MVTTTKWLLKLIKETKTIIYTLCVCFVNIRLIGGAPSKMLLVGRNIITITPKKVDAKSDLGYCLLRKKTQ